MSAHKDFFSKLKKKIAIITNKNIVLVGGCFDVLHYGHVIFLKQARSCGDYLVVALENDTFIRLHKKREPFHTQEERSEILENLRSVDMVLSLPNFSGYEDYYALVETIQPSSIAVTAHDPQLENKRQQALTVHAKVQTIPLLSKYSTTELLKNWQEKQKNG